MEHIRQLDWCFTETESKHFVTEDLIDNSCMERILRNKFHDPTLSESESEEPVKIDWDSVFTKKIKSGFTRVFVPGLQPVPKYPRLSALTVAQHHQCLRVLCDQNPEVLPEERMQKPTKADLRAFEDLKETYKKEQQEYVEWAKTVWTTAHCVRALKPKAALEAVYDAEFTLRRSEMRSLPQDYEWAAQIPLVTSGVRVHMEPVRDLVEVPADAVPALQLPALAGPAGVGRPCPSPAPCPKHPCRFVLPDTAAPSVLPLSEQLRALAGWALGRGARVVCAESGLRALLARAAAPLAVHAAPRPDGTLTTVVVVGAEFAPARREARARVRRAYRHLAYNALVPFNEKARVMSSWRQTAGAAGGGERDGDDDDDNHDDEDDDDNLVIDAEDPEAMDDAPELTDSDMRDSEPGPEHPRPDPGSTEADPGSTEADPGDTRPEPAKKKKPYYQCTCEGTWFERPPPRSYRLWRLRPAGAGAGAGSGAGLGAGALDVIVHCAHKARDSTGEVILDPVPEYQLELGAAGAAEGAVGAAEGAVGADEGAERVLALALALRKNASVIQVRLDALSGDIVSLDRRRLPGDRALGERAAEVRSRLHTALRQLLGLRPGHYLLRHEPEHGDNAMLYVATAAPAAPAAPAPAAPAPAPAADRLSLGAAPAPSDAEEARGLRAAPALAPVLLPYHKFRKILPCAFTPYANQVAKEPARPPPPGRARPPPAQAGQAGHASKGQRGKVPDTL